MLATPENKISTMLSIEIRDPIAPLRIFTSGVENNSETSAFSAKNSYHNAK